MKSRLTLGGLAVALILSGSALAGAQRDEPADRELTNTKEREVTVTKEVTPGRVKQAAFTLGSPSVVAIPGGAAVADVALVGERLVVATSGAEGPALLVSPDGKSWDTVAVSNLEGGDLQLIIPKLQEASDTGLVAAGSAPAAKTSVEQLAVVESTNLVDTTTRLISIADPGVIAGATWSVEVESVLAHAAGYVVSGRLIPDAKSAAGADFTDAAARDAAARGVAFSFGGASLAELAEVQGVDIGVGRTMVRTTVGTDNGLLSLGTKADGMPTAWSSTNASTWTEGLPAGLTGVDAVLDADSTGADVSLAGVNINGPMVWTSTDGGASFTPAILAQSPEDSFDVFAEQVVITDSGTLVLATRRAPVIAEGSTALRDSFIETLAWLVASDGSVSRATGTELFGTDGMVLEASADGGQVTVLLEDADGSTRVVLADL